MKTLKQILSLILTLCLLVPCLALAEDFDLSDLGITEEVILDDSFWDDEDEDEDGDNSLTEFIIGDGAQELEENLDALERDADVNPDDLELNPNLPSNVINILLIGVDMRDKDINSNSSLLHNDVTMILSINTDDGSIKLTSIARDLYVSIPGYKDKGRINTAYAIGTKRSDDGINHGAELTMRTVNHLFEMNITQYVVINFYGLASIIDYIGGIDLNIIRGEAYAINAYLKEHAKQMTYDEKGNANREPLVVVSEKEHESVQHLDGIQAVMYARLRSNMRSAPTGDLARTARQRYLLEQLLAKVLKNINMNNLAELIEVCYPYVKTNISAGTMLSIALGVLQGGVLGKLSSGESLIEQHRIPLDNTYSYEDVDGASVTVINSGSWNRNVQSVHYFIYGEYFPAK
ncbi:MAG: LCP family protein [Clostridia bacterium]|nr:LCP family protein [Clostridia bacterium]